MDSIVERTASWLNGTDPAATEPKGEDWACVEIFGHRKHYGRISEVERFGAKMLRVDVPTGAEAAFETFVYGGASIFSITPMTEQAARKWADYGRPKPQNLLAIEPPSYGDPGETDEDGRPL